VHLGLNRPITGSTHPGHLVGDEMHSDMLIGIAGTPIVLDLTLSFASTRLASYSDNSTFETWSLYIGVRFFAGSSLSL